MRPVCGLAVLLGAFTLLGGGSAFGEWPDVPPALPAPTGTVVHVSSEPALRSAVAALQSNTTIVIAPGTYQLTGTLAVHGPLQDVTIRGAGDRRDEVVLMGRGVHDSSVPHGIWVGGDVRRLTIANLTVRDVFYHPLIFNPGPQAPRVYNVRLVNGGEQLLKTNPNPNGTGIDDGIVEYSLFEYEPTSKNYYANAIQVLAGRRWIIRHNLIRNIRAPAGEMAGPAVLAWFSAADTVVEANTFVNCQREISFGLINRTPNDHAGGIIRNNVIYRDPDLPGGDVAIGVFDSAGTRVVHNTVFTPGTYPNAVEYRFPGSTGVVIANNLLSGDIRLRDGAAPASLSHNVTTATADLFVDAAARDLRLRADAGVARASGLPLDAAPTDWSGAARPVDGAPDLGAFQYVNAPTAPKHLRSGGKSQ